MEDPNEAAKIQAKMEHMMKVGQGELNAEAKDTMANAMQAMADPSVMAEAARMMKDPQFQEQLARMSKDPSFKKYVNAMQDMMQDPTTKAQMERISDSFRSAL
jgi:DNA-binding FadR family transcriptional regulator